MQYITKLRLASVHLLCDVEDKSTEYMYQLMQDTCNVNLDTVNNYFFLGEKEHLKLRKDLNNLLETLENLGEI